MCHLNSDAETKTTQQFWKCEPFNKYKPKFFHVYYYTNKQNRVLIRYRNPSTEELGFVSQEPRPLELELIQSHMAQKPVLRGEVGCACVAREVSVERGGMGERGCARRLGGWVWV